MPSRAVDCCSSVCYHTVMLKEWWAERHLQSLVCSRETTFDADCSATGVVPGERNLSGEAQAVAVNPCSGVCDSAAGNPVSIDSEAIQHVVLDHDADCVAESAGESVVVPDKMRTDSTQPAVAHG